MEKLSLAVDSSLLGDLNSAQRAAVLHEGGPLLVLAGAGSGKTRVLTYRIAHLVRERGVSPGSILAITFTNKAAGEMKERVERLVGGQFARRMWVSTFHSAAARILRMEIERLGYGKNFTIYDQADSLRMVTHCARDLDPKRFAPRALADRIGLLKNELIDQDSYSSQASSYFERALADVYRLYQERLRQNNALDFDDLLSVTVDLFQVFPEVLRAYQDRFRHILVDEFQDTNRAQYRIARLMAQEHRQLFVVGDDDQSIYSWRGADIRNILEFERDFPDTKVVKLEQNYRSTQRILSAANGVVRHNRGRKPKTLWTENAEGEPLLRYQAPTEFDEAAFTAGEIERLCREEGHAYADFALFYRTHAQSRVLEEIFTRFGIPYRIVGGLRFYERAEIKDLLAYLRVLTNPADGVSLRRIINVPKRGIGDTSLGHLDRYARVQNCSLYDALVHLDAIHQLSPRARRSLQEFWDFLTELKSASSDLSPSRLVEEVLDRSGLRAALRAEGTFEAQTRMENLEEFVVMVREFETAFPDRELADLLEQISLITDLDTFDEGQEAVTLMTFHNAKGLEFPIVFMTGMEEGVFPHIRSMGQDSELEEERRLCYVGMTRARERLILTHAVTRSLYGGGPSYQMPSRFLREVPEELVVTSAEAQAVPGATGPAAVAHDHFRVGEEVRHKKWGQGVVLQVVEKGSGTEVVVNFPGEGEKQLLLAYAPLEKVE